MTHIVIENTQRDLPLSIPQMKKVVSFLLEQLQISTDEISFHFVTERAITQLHKEIFNDPTPTDCITLPLDAPSAEGQGYHVLGEAVICPKTALLYAKNHDCDPYAELYRYVIHCLLHLIGYTDTTPQERARMKRKENACLKKLFDPKS